MIPYKERKENYVHFKLRIENMFSFGEIYGKYVAFFRKLGKNNQNNDKEKCVIFQGK